MICSQWLPRKICEQLEGDFERNTTAQVLEDNAGGLHLATNDGRSVYVGTIAPNHSLAGQLRDDLAALFDWIDDTRAERPEE